MLTNSELVLGGAGIGVLGSAIGALITWRASLGTTLAATRAQRALEADRRRDDRRTDLYRDMLMRARHILRTQSLHRVATPKPEPSLEEIVELDSWSARVALFASPEVSSLWDAWFAIHMEGWEIRRTGLKAEVDRKRYGDQTGRREAAHRALVEQMRKELES